MKSADIGIIGLAVMGENLCLNIESKGFCVSVYNRTVQKTQDFISSRAKGKNIIGCDNLEEFIGTLKTPRKIMLMVKAGQVVDDFISMLLPLLNEGDIIIDGGNSHYLDSIRRTKHLEQSKLYFIGAGVSGGEEGALNGPSIMPGGSYAAWEHIKDIFTAISAKTEDMSPCCGWVSSDGAGHFVKMVHNGIEYGDMQLICEAYQIMRQYLCMSTDEMHVVFNDWNKGRLNSYLIKITADILAYKENGVIVIDNILDQAGQKGTGKWAGVASFELGVPLTTISEAVYARFLSTLKNERMYASKILPSPKIVLPENKVAFISSIKNALYAAKVISYAQGFALLKSAAKEYNWQIDFGNIALIWRGGCIIRSAFLDNIKDAFSNNPNLDNLLVDPFFKSEIEKSQEGFRDVCAAAMLNGVSIPAFSSALAYYDGYRAACLPANLLQAQRDYFGAHTYERLDMPKGEFFHTNWTGKGGNTSSSSYNA